ncbi:hypothetical protein BJV77DRAFT_1056987, partial [Russula vinacea]
MSTTSWEPPPFSAVCVTEHYSAQLNEGGESRVEGKNVIQITTTESEVTPFPDCVIEVDQKQIVSSTDEFGYRGPGHVLSRGDRPDPWRVYHRYRQMLLLRVVLSTTGSGFVLILGPDCRRDDCEGHPC